MPSSALVVAFFFEYNHVQQKRGASSNKQHTLVLNMCWLEYIDEYGQEPCTWPCYYVGQLLQLIDATKMVQVNSITYPLINLWAVLVKNYNPIIPSFPFEEIKANDK